MAGTAGLALAPDFDRAKAASYCTSALGEFNPWMDSSTDIKGFVGCS
jgi:hypothetical protein